MVQHMFPLHLHLPDSEIRATQGFHRFTCCNILNTAVLGDQQMAKADDSVLVSGMRDSKSKEYHFMEKRAILNDG